MEVRRIFVIAIALMLWFVPMNILATTLPSWYMTQLTRISRIETM
ncbi:MAG: hypothetical protein U0L19_00115 [Bacteroidales bacterium]|nr:hypothetical protein [Bacteroidales bacterium]